ncbi:hypothetical protein HY630_01515 [Candidatus Uhrbacteria bacterium]|nr:hypothetical protein [Candidatus Uhrbacteria bacterium]
MVQLSRNQKRWMGRGLVSLFLVSFLAVGLLAFSAPVQAQDSAAMTAGELAAGAAEGGCGASPGGPCPQKGIKNALKTVGEKIFSPAFRIALIQALLNLSQFVLNRLAYEAAVAIASGGAGEDSLFYNQTPSEAFGQLGLEVAGEAIGSISELSSSQLGIEFNLCEPSGDLGETLQLSLKLGIKQKYQPSEPKCDFMEVISNWEAFGASTYQKYLDPKGRQEAILSSFAGALQPGQNELTATLRINIAVDQKIHEQKLLQFAQRNESTYKDVTDFVTGNIKTPSETLQADFEGALEKSKGDDSQIRVGEIANAGDLIGGLALSTASTFTNTLLSQLMNRIYTGLFDTESVNPFNLEAPGGGDREAAQERFASIIATNPIATTKYDALSEFVVCTAEGTINRGLNNCVMDVNFLAAVNRGTAGVPLTVQEAIDEGLLNANWPLIPPDNEAANQDPFCHTYGYCYGNLVKLRKARVLPIGWELAAQRNSESNPATLQEVIDGFNDCTENGTIGPAGAADSNNKWCHLIDPNWVLKYPQTECRAVGNGEIRISTLSPGRNTSCVDAPSCIGEDNDGNCVDGYGYCVQEKNVWRFRGNECPQEYATCLSFTNTETGDTGDFLVSTVNYSVCDQDNAGCRWYRTGKYLEDAGTEDPADDTYEWLATGDDYVLAERDADVNAPTWNGTAWETAGRGAYIYTSGETYTYEQYAYEDRLYLTNNATSCSEGDVGCTQLYPFEQGVYLNTVQNPSFEEDEDSDGTPDGWTPIDSSSIFLDTSTSAFGSTSLRLTPGNSNYVSQIVQAAEHNFYTFSGYFQAQTSGDEVLVQISFLDADGVPLDAAGTSFSGDCTWDAVNDWYEIIEAPSTDDFDRFECLMTTPENTVQILVEVANTPTYATGNLFVDALQLELGEDANIFAEGYSGSPSEVYYQIAPSYLGCTGKPTDPEACDSYAQVCSAQEVGCSLYAPEDGDPSVPAIISELDACPSECVGYATYKQEATDFESQSFPLYFIADSASTCSEQFVGCDSYTNLGSVEAGGEGIEYYTDLRFCLSPDIADATATNKTPATYFTWEGSDNEGYQLQTWSLLQSNYGGATDTFDSCTPSLEPPLGCTPFEETDPELAPCTHIQMNSENEVVCGDSNSAMQDDVWANEACDEHDDIFGNPDCREFFDTEGNIHYRQYSDTISISDECAAYRKDESTACDCQGNVSSDCPIATFGVQEGSGGYWTDQGFCRYYVLPEESVECPAEQNGCRAYTGGAGRNATTILSETFEGGTYEDFAMADLSSFPDEIAISNESVATEGHSLYVLAPSGGTAGIDTVQVYLGPSNIDTYDEDDPTSCTGVVGTGGCDVTNDIDGDGSEDEDCTVLDGEGSCGALTDDLVAGKTFVLEFWAKGSGSLAVTFEEEGGAGSSRNFVDPQNDPLIPDDLTLSGAWQLYSLGPIDTSAYDDFDENAVLRFATGADAEFYLDNVTLKQVEENITIIKDSWVVPSTCDQTPQAVDSPQFYLGCEAYTDHNGNDVDLYQFSDLCSEEVVGCEGFYQTANSESPYTQVYNARCVYSNDLDFTDGDVRTSNVACEIDGVEYCTIIAGQGYCVFDANQAFGGVLPVETVSATERYAVVYGPETVVISGDTPVYIVEDDRYACTSSAMGCQEFGSPTYTQDQSEVESFESVYYINLPADYGTLLCDNEALFCEEWESTQDGNFYFKDPLDKECEYKTSVTMENRSYFGWFRSGTNEPCYWEDIDNDGSYDRDQDEAYLIAGEEFGVWNNGDEDDGDGDAWDYYDGWVAACERKYDLCTEFIDVVDTGGGLNEEGQSYYFTNDELLNEETLTDSQRCNGQVSQKFGCAVFNNTTVSELTYNASASYILSRHADVFYGKEEDALVDPVSCTTEGGGEFTISSANAAVAGTGTTVDLCARRCLYQLQIGDSLTTSSSDTGVASSFSNPVYDASCFVDSDCATLPTYNGEEVSGTCSNVSSIFSLEDDSNEVIKVNRDRSCASWLACESSRTSWNTSTNKYDTICDSINLCVDGQQQGDRAICSAWDESDPTILSAYQYSLRDVSWSGYEYSGNAIPNQLPVELYDQFNVETEAYCNDPDGTPENPEAVPVLNDLGFPIVCSTHTDCSSDTGQACTSDAACVSAGYTQCDTASGTCFYNCEASTQQDYRLVYNAGPCDSTEAGDGNGGSCTVGHCSETGTACADNSDCTEEEDCIVGYYQATGSLNCGNEDCTCNPDNNDPNDQTNPDCTTATSSSLPSVPTPVCDPAQFVCVDELTTDEDARDPCVTNSTTRTCVPVESSSVGTCFNNRCLSDIVDRNGDGYADPLQVDVARDEECRAYPEIDSPYSPDIVETWIEYSGADIEADGEPPVSILPDPGVLSPSSQAALPYGFVNGFQDSNVCALDLQGNVVDCSCSYDKAKYGQGTGYRYFSLASNPDDVPDGICSGGPVSGIPCTDNDDCTLATSSEDQSGICTFLTRVDSIYGWSGYCIERDTSIQTMGSTANEDQACLTWLPVDQLTGATDLYGKYTSAGYAPQNTYYCAEVGTAYNIQTSSIACAEVQDNQCNYGSWANFRDEADAVGSDEPLNPALNNPQAEDDCIAAVFCPEGYFAVMTGCGDQAEVGGVPVDSGQCSALVGDDDCPYFCVPKRSYKVADDETFPAGTECEIPTQRWPTAFSSSSGYVRTPGDIDDYFASSNLTPDISIYVMEPDDFATAYEFYDDCWVQGVVENVPEYYEFASNDEFEYVDGMDEILTLNGTRTKGYRGLDMRYESYFACLTTVQVASNILESDEAFNTYNAAWTDRLYEDQISFPALTGGDTEHLGYSYSTPIIPYGRALDWLDLDAQADPGPHRILMCRDVENVDVIQLPLADGSCDVDDFPASTEEIESSSYFDARAYVSISQSSDIPLVYEDYCEDPSTCSCDDSGDPSDAMCNSDGGNPIECGNFECVGGDFDGTDCTIPEEDAPDACAPGGGYCAGSCQGGPNNGYQCGTDDPNDAVCEPNFCTNTRNCSGESNASMQDCLDLPPVYACRASEPESASGIVQSIGSIASARSRLSQLFGAIYGIVQFSDGYTNIRTADLDSMFEGEGITGEFTLFNEENYVPFSTVYGEWDWDTRGVREDAENHVPVVLSVGECEGTSCYEGSTGKFSVNEVDSGTVEGEGAKRVTVSFYTYADSDQMPIRRIIVDWGDDFASITGDIPWPSGSQSGSITPDNFYKNYRGLSPTSDTQQCSDDADEFGQYTQACSSSYVAFTHDYVCTTGRLEQLIAAGVERECTFDEDGRLINSPCYDGQSCVFQPRVHVMDNWGWCTGTCDSGPDSDGTDGCYTGVTDYETGADQDECDIENCPSENSSSSSCDDNGGGIVNPWINYDGAVYILAE